MPGSRLEELPGLSGALTQLLTWAVSPFPSPGALLVAPGFAPAPFISVLWLTGRPDDCIFTSVCWSQFLQFHELLHRSPNILTSVVFLHSANFVICLRKGNNCVWPLLCFSISGEAVAAATILLKSPCAQCTLCIKVLNLVCFLLGLLCWISLPCCFRAD